MDMAVMEPGARGAAGSAHLPFYLTESQGRCLVRGQTECVENGRAYVVMPYGTAKAPKQIWDAVMVLPADDAAGRAVEKHMLVQLISAECRQAADGVEEGLWVRFLGEPQDEPCCAAAQPGGRLSQDAAWPQAPGSDRFAY